MTPQPSRLVWEPPDRTGDASATPADLQATLERLAADEHRPAGRVRRSVEALGQHDLLTAPLTPDLGGRTLAGSADSAEEAVALLIRIGSADLSLARLYEGHLNALNLVAVHGSPDQQVRIADLVRQGGLLGVWGADAQPPLTLDAGQLSGAKRYCSGLGIVGAVIVTAASPEGQRMVFADDLDPVRSDPASWTATGMRATFSGGYDFDGVPAGPETLVGAPDALGTEPWFFGGVWRIAAAELGGTFGLLEAARRHLASRDRLGDATQIARLGRCLISAHAATRLAVTAAEYASGPAGRAAPARAADLSIMARLAAERSAAETLDAVAAACGLEGCVAGSDLDRRRRDLATYTCQIAPDGLLRRAAGNLLDDPRPLAEAFHAGT